MISKNGNTAEGYELLAMNLYEHINNYIPKGCIEPIDDNDFAPTISKKEAEKLMESFENSSLRESVKEYKPYVGEAILDFFENGEYKSSAG